MSQRRSEAVVRRAPGGSSVARWRPCLAGVSVFVLAAAALLLGALSAPTAAAASPSPHSSSGLTWSSRQYVDPDFWQREEYLGEGGVGLVSVSCVSASFCMGVEDEGYAFVFDGSSWSAPVRIDPQGVSCTNDICDGGTGLISVSCASPSFCAAVDGYGNAFTFNGSSWKT